MNRLNSNAKRRSVVQITLGRKASQKSRGLGPGEGRQQRRAETDQAGRKQVNWAHSEAGPQAWLQVCLSGDDAYRSNR